MDEEKITPGQVARQVQLEFDARNGEKPVYLLQRMADGRYLGQGHGWTAEPAKALRFTSPNEAKHNAPRDEGVVCRRVALVKDFPEPGVLGVVCRRRHDGRFRTSPENGQPWSLEPADAHWFKAVDDIPVSGTREFPAGDFLAVVTVGS